MEKVRKSQDNLEEDNWRMYLTKYQDLLWHSASLGTANIYKYISETKNSTQITD